jgi:hypothetical protein
MAGEVQHTNRKFIGVWEPLNPAPCKHSTLDDFQPLAVQMHKVLPRMYRIDAKVGSRLVPQP